MKTKKLIGAISLLLVATHSHGATVNLVLADFADNGVTRNGGDVFDETFSTFDPDVSGTLVFTPTPIGGGLEWADDGADAPNDAEYVGLNANGPVFTAPASPAGSFAVTESGGMNFAFTGITFGDIANTPLQVTGTDAMGTFTEAISNGSGPTDPRFANVSSVSFTIDTPATGLAFATIESLDFGTAVPEPSSALLLGLGALGLLRRRR